MRFGFIGAGKVGTSLGKYFSLHNLEVSGFFSKSPSSKEFAASFCSCKAFSSTEDLIKNSDVIFFTLPDDALKSVFESIDSSLLKDKTLIHCSGSLCANEVFGSHKNALSFHPMMAVSSKEESYKEFNKAFFTLEGHSSSFDSFLRLFKDAKLNVHPLSSEYKVKYHLAAVTVSNLCVALFNEGQKLLCQCGFTPDDAKTALTPLFLGNSRAICEKGCEAALTGPVQRNDIGTIKKHIKELSGSDLELYLLLSEKLTHIAMAKSPEVSFDELKDFLINRQKL